MYFFYDKWGLQVILESKVGGALVTERKALD
jgi:hypothetical protein